MPLREGRRALPVGSWSSEMWRRMGRLSVRRDAGRYIAWKRRLLSAITRVSAGQNAIEERVGQAGYPVLVR